LDIDPANGRFCGEAAVRQTDVEIRHSLHHVVGAVERHRYNAETLPIPELLCKHYDFSNGINASGQITGEYQVGGEAHSFLYSGGTYTTIDDPLGVATYAQAINDAGQIAGWYADSSGLAHGFPYSGSTYTTIDDPLATPGGGTYTFAINTSGQLTGFYQDSSGTSHAFLATPIPNPVMSDVKADHRLTTLSGTAEANSNVSIFDGTHLIGTVAFCFRWDMEPADETRAWHPQLHRNFDRSRGKHRLVLRRYSIRVKCPSGVARRVGKRCSDWTSKRHAHEWCRRRYFCVQSEIRQGDDHGFQR
jgi:hypothetical protein